MVENKLCRVISLLKCLFEKKNCLSVCLPYFFVSADARDLDLMTLFFVRLARCTRDSRLHFHRANTLLKYALFDYFVLTDRHVDVGMERVVTCKIRILDFQ